MHRFVFFKLERNLFIIIGVVTGWPTRTTVFFAFWNSIRGIIGFFIATKDPFVLAPLACGAEIVVVNGLAVVVNSVADIPSISIGEIQHESLGIKRFLDFKFATEQQTLFTLCSPVGHFTLFKIVHGK